MAQAQTAPAVDWLRDNDPAAYATQPRRQLATRSPPRQTRRAHRAPRIGYAANPKQATQQALEWLRKNDRDTHAWTTARLAENGHGYVRPSGLGIGLGQVLAAGVVIGLVTWVGLSLRKKPKPPRLAIVQAPVSVIPAWAMS